MPILRFRRQNTCHLVQNNNLFMLPCFLDRHYYESVSFSSSFSCLVKGCLLLSHVLQKDLRQFRRCHFLNRIVANMNYDVLNIQLFVHLHLEQIQNRLSQAAILLIHQCQIQQLLLILAQHVGLQNHIYHFLFGLCHYRHLFYYIFLNCFLLQILLRLIVFFYLFTLEIFLDQGILIMQIPLLFFLSFFRIVSSRVPSF